MEFVVVQSPNHVQLFTTPWRVAHQASLLTEFTLSLIKLNILDTLSGMFYYPHFTE